MLCLLYIVHCMVVVLTQRCWGVNALCLELYVMWQLRYACIVSMFSAVQHTALTSGAFSPFPTLVCVHSLLQHVLGSVTKADIHVSQQIAIPFDRTYLCA